VPQVNFSFIRASTPWKQKTNLRSGARASHRDELIDKKGRWRGSQFFAKGPLTSAKARSLGETCPSFSERISLLREIADVMFARNRPKSGEIGPSEGKKEESAQKETKRRPIWAVPLEGAFE